VPPKGGMTSAAVAAVPIAPQLPSGPLKPLAKGSDPFEPAVSSETALRRMSDDMSGPLSGMPVGTTTIAHVATTSVPAGQRPNKTPIFITGVTDTRGFLIWLRGVLPLFSYGPAHGREVDGRPINRRWLQNHGQRAAVP
jgi:hypothetical protein